MTNYVLQSSSPLRANFDEAISYYRFQFATMDWDEFFDWLKGNNSFKYSKVMLSYAKKYGHMGFDFKLVSYEKIRKKNDILKAIANVCRFIDIKYDTMVHDVFKKWLKKKEIKWNVKHTSHTYEMAKSIKFEEVLKNIENNPHHYKDFVKFVLVSGLRTDEAVKAWNNHDALCHDGIIELFWDRGTKNANATYCLCKIHNRINFKVTQKTLYKYFSAKNLGCEVRYLRKINYTINSTKIDPLLAEFMQGRRGNVSQKHYFLPLMQGSNSKWENVWNEFIT